MRLTFKQGLISFLSAVFFAAAIWTSVPATAASANADEGNITCATASGNYLDEDYLSVYRIPTDMMTYEANGGARTTIPFRTRLTETGTRSGRRVLKIKGKARLTPSF